MIEHYLRNRGIDPSKLWSIETPVDRDVYLCHMIGMKGPLVITGAEWEKEWVVMQAMNRTIVTVEMGDEQTGEE